MQDTKTKAAANKKDTGSNRTPFFQPKLTVNQPNDVYEREADVMADRVMRMVDTSPNENAFFKPVINNHVQRKCQHCEEEEKLHRKESSDADVQGSSELDSYVSTLGSSGQRLSENSKAFFEPRFGQDFSNVRIHNDSVAAKSAQSINALAYTTGNNIVFNQGQYSPDSENGKKLMAHELTHVVQQKGKGLGSDLQRQSTETKTESRNFNTAVEGVLDSWTYMIAQQKDSLQLFYDNASKKDPPKIDRVGDFIITVMESALLGAIGGIVGGILNNIVKEHFDGKNIEEKFNLSNNLKAAIITGTGDSAKAVVRDGIRKAYQTQVKSNPSDSLSLFVFTQKSALNTMLESIRNNFRNIEVPKLEGTENQSPNGKKILDDMKSSIDETADFESGIDGNTYQHSVSAWAVYLARSNYGTHDVGADRPKETSGTDLSKVDLIDTLSGVLSLDLQLDSPQSAPIIRSAKIGGLNSLLRASLNNKPIRSLNIPLVTNIYGYPIGINEGKTISLLPRGSDGNWFFHSYQGIQYLYDKARPNNTEPKLHATVSIAAFKVNYTPSDLNEWDRRIQVAYEGARILFEKEIGEQTLILTQ